MNQSKQIKKDMKLYYNLLLLLIIVIFFLIGCGGGGSGGPSEVSISDYEATFPSFRMRHDLLPTKESTKLFFLELDIANARGKSSQDLEPGKYIDLKDTTFSGPSEVKSEYNLSNITAATGWGFNVRQRSSFQFLGGVGATKLDLKANSEGISVQDEFDKVGVFLGLHIGFTPWEKVGLYFRESISSDYRSYTFITTEFGTVISLREKLSLFTGLRTWDFNDSEANLFLLGLMAGLSLDY